MNLLQDPGDVELALRAIGTKLQGLKTENGYRYDIQTVYRSFLRMNDLDSLESPALFIGRTPGDRVSLQPLEPSGYEATIPFSIIGFIRRGADNAEDDEAASQAEALISDITKMQLADPKWGTSSGAGAIKSSWIQASEHAADWDDSGIQVEVLGKCITTIEGSNP